MFQTILFGTDFSAGSRRALRLALDLARSEKAKLLVVHAAPSFAIADVEGRLVPRVRNQVEAAAHRDAERRIGRIVKQAQEARVRAEGLVVSGDAAAAINRAARRHRADLVMIGTHGRSGFKRALLGSVAAEVIGTASRPVLTVRSTGRSA